LRDQCQPIEDYSPTHSYQSLKCQADLFVVVVLFRLVEVLAQDFKALPLFESYGLKPDEPFPLLLFGVP
jgi:hypothetical protein